MIRGPMMRKHAAASLLFASVISLLALATFSADLPEHWRAWRYSRSVSANTSQSAAPAEILLPWDVFAHCKTACADLRLIDALGYEVPYELRTARETATSESFSARIIEKSFVAGQYTQIVGDLGQPAPFYSVVRVDTGAPDFIVWAEVALSDDAKSWRVVEPRAPIARFRKRSVNGTQTIPFQGLNSRYLRVRIFETAQQFPATGLTVFSHSEAHPLERIPVPASFGPAKIDDTESAWTADLATSHIPVSELRFTTDSPEFYRAVRVAASADGKAWFDHGSGCIYRYQQAGTIREKLSIDFPEWPENQLLRVEVINNSDQPLRGVALSLYAIPRKLLFKPQPGATYKILYGNQRAIAPQYDLGRYLDAGPAKPVYEKLSLGNQEITANYLDPRPFSERHPEVLWISLAIAIVLIGLTAIKTLRQSSATNGAAQT